MIITEKQTTITLLESNNPFDHIFNSKIQRNKAFKNNNSTPIYFYRYIGVEDTQANYMDKLKNLDHRLKNSLFSYINVIDGLTKNFSSEEISRANKLLAEFIHWENNPNRTDINLFNLNWNKKMNWTSKKRFVEIYEYFKATEKNINETIIKNFGILMILWIDTYLPELFPIQNNNEIPKILYYGNIKRNEVYFLIYISTLGCDVLYINPSEDEQFSRIDPLNIYSKLLEYPNKIELIAFPKASEETLPLVDKPIDLVAENKITSISTKPIEVEKSYEELANLASSVVMIKIFDDNLVHCGNGSGVVIDSKGLIVTNFHVVNNGRIFEVLFENDVNNSIPAKLIKVNQNYDLALLKIQCEAKPIPIRDKDTLKRGQQIVAIGSPLGLMNTISDGIVAGFRNFENENFIQITAPISPGSSGGALLDRYGYLVGITTAGYSEGQNLNLAVPSSELLKLLNK